MAAADPSDKRESIRAFFETMGGVEGYLTLKSMEPELADEVVAAFGLEFAKPKGNEPQGERVNES